MKLNLLSDEELHAQTGLLAKEERGILVKLLWHLKEIDERKLYCDVKCGSLFEYCLKILKYSEGEATRRVIAARLLREMPEMASQIESGKLNLTQLNLARKFFKEEDIQDKHQKKEVLEMIQGKSTRESDKILWELKKDKGPRKVQMTIQEETHNTLKRLHALKAHTCPTMDGLLLKMSEDVLSVWNPLKASRQKRRSHNESSRYVPREVKVQVWRRDQGQCQNCGSTYALEFDHIQAFAHGGKTEQNNLKLLCRECNQRKGIVQFGRRVFSYALGVH